MHALDAKTIETGDSVRTCTNLFGKKLAPIIVDQKLQENDVLNGFKIVHTPGHTPGSICLYHEAEKILISGDTVFDAFSVGRTDLPGGNKEQLKASLEKLSLLDVKTILPGHGSMVLEDGANAIRNALTIV